MTVVIGFNVNRFSIVIPHHLYPEFNPAVEGFVLHEEYYEIEIEVELFWHRKSGIKSLQLRDNRDDASPSPIHHT